MIISMTTPRADDILHQRNGQIINAPIKQKFSSDQNTVCCDHSNMLMNGDPSPVYLADDGYQLSAIGISVLARNTKKAIHNNLNIPLPDRGRSRFRFRHNRRGRGCGFSD
jgi:hypothetical protein